MRNNDPIIPPPVVVYGKHRGTPLIIFGEVHNDIDNRFYENLDLQNCTVFVEHASVLSTISMEDKARLIAHVKGSDWIWYKYSARNLPVVCVDNRIEIGLPTSIEEQIAMESNNLSLVLRIAMKTMRIVINPDTKKKIEKTKLAPIYLRLAQVVRKQMELLLRENSLETPELMLIKWKMIRNLVIMAGLMVDLHVVDLIQNHTENRPITIFMGAAHAYRLHTFFPEMFPDMETHAITPDVKKIVETLVYE